MIRQLDSGVEDLTVAAMGRHLMTPSVRRAARLLPSKLRSSLVTAAPTPASALLTMSTHLVMIEKRDWRYAHTCKIGEYSYGKS